MDPEIVAALLVAATAAGWVDAVVGGGGLILIPTLLVAFPTMAPATVLGTNKLTAITGTSVAAVTYARRTKLDRSVALSAAGLAIPSAGVGALSASSLPSDWFRPLIMALLIGVAAFVTLRPSFGSVIETADAVSRRRRLMASAWPAAASASTTVSSDPAPAPSSS